MKIVVAVVRGGPNDEHDVSLETGRMVLKALDPERYQVIDIVIGRNGEWLRENKLLLPDSALSDVDLVFNALHGVYGGDGTVQKVYEALGVWHTGSGALASTYSFNKIHTKRIAEKSGIKVPRHTTVLRDSDIEQEKQRILTLFALPLIVKPSGGSSSLGVTFVDTPEKLAESIGTALALAPEALVEEFVHGREVTTGVVESLGGDFLRALPSFEIILSSKYTFYDFEAKYAETNLREESPGSLRPEEQKMLADAARTMHTHLGLKHYSRSDFRVNESGIHYLETNSDPVLGENDLLPQSLSKAGHSFSHFVDHVVGLTRGQMSAGTTCIAKPRYVKYFTRTLSVIESELWQRGERVELPAMNGKGYFFHPLFTFTPGKGTSVYYNMADSRQDPRSMAYYFTDNRQEFLDILETSRQYISLLGKVSHTKPSSFSMVLHCLARAWPGIALANTFASECRHLVDDAVRNASHQLFADTEHVLYVGEAAIRTWLLRNLPEDVRPFASVVKYDEVLTMCFPERWELEARMKGFVLYRGKLFAASLRDTARRHGLIIAGSTREFTGHLRGSVVCRGRTRGPARIVFEADQVEKVKEGDVLVTSMTTPDLLPALQRAVAFVTDEGSLTSEPTIVARQMKKPFITGTGCATEFLKDGDMVEVDAEEGVVRLVGEK